MKTAFGFLASTTGPTITGMIAWAHLIKFPNYDTRVNLLEAVAKSQA